MKYEIILTSMVQKDMKKLHSKGVNLKLFDAVISKIAKLNYLCDQYNDYPLMDPKHWGQNCRSVEFSLGWFIIYKYDHKNGEVTIVRTGSKKLFGK